MHPSWEAQPLPYLVATNRQEAPFPLAGDSHLQTIPYLQRVCPLNIRRRDLRSTALRSSPTREKKQDE